MDMIIFFKYFAKQNIYIKVYADRTVDVLDSEFNEIACFNLNSNLTRIEKETLEEADKESIQISALDEKYLFVVDYHKFYSKQQYSLSVWSNRGKCVWKDGFISYARGLMLVDLIHHTAQAMLIFGKYISLISWSANLIKEYSRQEIGVNLLDSEPIDIATSAGTLELKKSIIEDSNSHIDERRDAYVDLTGNRIFMLFRHNDSFILFKEWHEQQPYSLEFNYVDGALTKRENRTNFLEPKTIDILGMVVFTDEKFAFISIHFESRIYKLDLFDINEKRYISSFTVNDAQISMPRRNSFTIYANCGSSHCAKILQSISTYFNGEKDIYEDIYQFLIGTNNGRLAMCNSWPGEICVIDGTKVTKRRSAYQECIQTGIVFFASQNPSSSEIDAKASESELSSQKIDILLNRPTMQKGTCV